jgi:hypothetical protein
MKEGICINKRVAFQSPGSLAFIQRTTKHELDAGDSAAFSDIFLAFFLQ